MNIFLICPVRNANDEQKQSMKKYIEKLEDNDITVYYPARDTNQHDDTGFRICKDNLNAIKNSDEVHIFWDKTSQGSLFDLGMAFALNKNLKIVNIDDVESTVGKSFANMIKEWNSNANCCN